MKEIQPEAREEVKETAIQLESKNISLTPYGVEFLAAPSIEEWKRAVLTVQKVHGMTQFYLGDLAIYANNTEVTGWGESKYDDLVASTGYEYITLSNYASVARRFTPTFREEILKQCDSNHNISFAHFRLVMSLDDNFASYYLRKAADNRWGIARLREELEREYYEAEEETPIGYISFKKVSRSIINEYVPQHEDTEYDEKTCLIELSDYISKRLEKVYNVVDG